jgi:hypothetical protein
VSTGTRSHAIASAIQGFSISEDSIENGYALPPGAKPRKYILLSKRICGEKNIWRADFSIENFAKAGSGLPKATEPLMEVRVRFGVRR